MISIDFTSEKSRQEFLKLKDGDFEEKQIYKFIIRAFKDIKNNLSCCIRIPKKLWPKEYEKFGINNLWKYDLPKGWRLIFFMKADEIKIVAIILEWFSHKDYEKRFKY